MKMTNDKNDLRIISKNKRKELSTLDRKHYDSLILENVLNDQKFKDSNTIFIYVSYKDEVDTHEIIKSALLLNKKVCVPLIISKKDAMEAIYINSLEDLEANYMGILEPKYNKDNVAKAEDIDVVFVPGLAFDTNGGRLGYGGGFYDRFLKNLKKQAVKIALAYENQIVDYVPMEPLDVKTDYIISNKK